VKRTIISAAITLFTAVYSWTGHQGASGYDNGRNLAIGRDGSLMVTGRTYSYAMYSYDYQVIIMHLDSLGNLVRFNNYGLHCDGCYDAGWNIDTTDDGGYVIIGKSQSFPPLLRKFSGGYIKVYDLELGRYDSTEVESSDFGDKTYYVDNLLLLKITADGDTVMRKIYGFPSTFERGWRIINLPGDYYIAAGTASPYGDNDLYLLKLNGALDTLWTAIYRSSISEQARDVVPCSDGGYFLVGQSEGVSPGYLYALKVDSVGNLIWNKVINGYAGRCGTIYDGFYYAAGFSNYSSGGHDGILFKFSPEGDSVGYAVFGDGPEATTTEAIYAMCAAEDGLVMVGSNTYSACTDTAPDGWIVKTDGDGEIIWDLVIGGPAKDEFLGIVKDKDGDGYKITGTTFSYGSGGDVWIVDISEDGDTITSSLGSEGEISSPEFQISLFTQPNPFNNSCDIVVTGTAKDRAVVDIFDINGGKLFTFKMDVPGEISWNPGRNTPSGGYIVRISTPAMTLSRRVYYVK